MEHLSRLEKEEVTVSWQMEKKTNIKTILKLTNFTDTEHLVM